MIVCVQITGKLVLCKFSANNVDKMSIFFVVSKVARGHNFVSRNPIKGWRADMMQRLVPRMTSSFLRRQDVVPGSCSMKFNWFKLVTVIKAGAIMSVATVRAPALLQHAS